MILTWWGTESTSVGRWWCSKSSTWRSTTSPSNSTHSTTEFWFEVVSSTSLVHTSITTTWWTTWTSSLVTLVIWSITPWFGSFPQRGRHNFRWKMKVVTQVLNAFIGQVPIKMPPCEVLTHIATRFQRLHCLDDFKVPYFLELIVTFKVEILESNHDSILK